MKNVTNLICVVFILIQPVFCDTVFTNMAESKISQTKNIIFYISGEKLKVVSDTNTNMYYMVSNGYYINTNNTLYIAFVKFDITNCTFAMNEIKGMYTPTETIITEPKNTNIFYWYSKSTNEEPNFDAFLDD